MPRPPCPRLIRLLLWDHGERQCAYCGCRFNTIDDCTLDHILPRCCGGTSDHRNLVLSCRQCNQRKGWRCQRPEFVRGNVMRYKHTTRRGISFTAYRIKREGLEW